MIHTVSAKWTKFFKGDNELQEENLKACISQNEKFLGECILGCDGYGDYYSDDYYTDYYYTDAACKNRCISQFENNFSECPCQVI